MHPNHLHLRQLRKEVSAPSVRPVLHSRDVTSNLQVVRRAPVNTHWKELSSNIPHQREYNPRDEHISSTLRNVAAKSPIACVDPMHIPSRNSKME